MKKNIKQYVTLGTVVVLSAFVANSVAAQETETSEVSTPELVQPVHQRLRFRKYNINRVTLRKLLYNLEQLKLLLRINLPQRMRFREYNLNRIILRKLLYNLEQSKLLLRIHLLQRKKLLS